MYVLVIYNCISFDPLVYYLTFLMYLLPIFYFNLKIFVKYFDIICNLLLKYVLEFFIKKKQCKQKL